MTNSLFDLSGRTALITGGTGVLGTAMAIGLANAGVKVAVLGRRPEAGELVVKQVKANGGEAIFIQADVLDAEGLEKANEKMISLLGKNDILVNAAGGDMAQAVIAPDKTFIDLQIPEFEKVVDLNLTGTVLPSTIFAKSMVDHKKGLIINIAS